MHNRYTAGHLAALLTILIWGTTFISTKVLLVSFSPVEILFFRFTAGYLALWAVRPRLPRFAGVRRELTFAAAGLCGVTLYFLLENIALTYTLASNVGVIIAIAPFITAILAHLLLRGERLHPLFFAGFAASLAGIFLIGFNGSRLLHLNPLGDFLAVCAAAVWAVYSVLMKKIGEYGGDTVLCTRRIFFYGLVFMLPALPLMRFRFGWERFASPSNLGNILYLGLGASALCFVTWNWAVTIIGAVKTSVYIYLVPVVTVTASALLLREKITWIAMLGTLLTLAGLLLSERRRKEKPAPVPNPE